MGEETEPYRYKRVRGAVHKMDSPLCIFKVR